MSEDATGLGDDVAARILSSLAELDVEDHRFERASESAERALRISERLEGPDNPNVLPKLVAMGRAARALGRLPLAEEVLERAVVISKLPDADPRYGSAAKLYLAETLTDMRIEAPRALALAREARDVAERGGAISIADRVAAETWLGIHGSSADRLPPIH